MAYTGAIKRDLWIIRPAKISSTGNVLFVFACLWAANRVRCAMVIICPIFHLDWGTRSDHLLVSSVSCAHILCSTLKSEVGYNESQKPSVHTREEYAKDQILSRGMSAGYPNHLNHQTSDGEHSAASWIWLSKFFHLLKRWDIFKFEYVLWWVFCSQNFYNL